MLKTLKPFVLSRFLYGLVQVMSLSSQGALI